jgi:hypothetical protein
MLADTAEKTEDTNPAGAKADLEAAERLATAKDPDEAPAAANPAQAWVNAGEK